MKTLTLTVFLTFFLCLAGHSQQLVYTPVNPNFGGNPLNYSGLLTSANAQNKYDDKKSETTSLLDSFSETMKRQILSQLTRGLLDDNENIKDLSKGTFEVNNLIVSVDETRTGTVIRIIDNDTGEVTEIIL